MFRQTSRTRTNRSTMTTLLALAALAAVLASALPARAGDPRWMLVYYRQLGNAVNANNRTIENHLFRADGSKGAGVGVTNQSNSGFAIFGTADVDGHLRVNTDLNNCTYDMRIYDPGVATDQSPVLRYQNPTLNHYYTYVLHWMRVPDDAQVTAYPQMPVYHYDLVNGLNSATGYGGGCTPQDWVEAPGANSDAFGLTSFTEPHFQTFLVPGEINRIVSAQVFATRSLQSPKFRYRATIVQDNGGSITTWPAAGPSAISRCVFSNEFKEVTVNWPLDAVPVVPGGRYALRVEVEHDASCTTDFSAGFNLYATNNDNYPDGHLYHGNTPVPGRDMVAVVVGVRFDVLDPPVIVHSPSVIHRTVAKGSNLPNDTFTISNGGQQTLHYTLSDDVPWLSTVPSSGSIATGPETINIVYDTASLDLGPHTGTITINAPGAPNTPQTVTVHLTVETPPFSKADHDEDGDVDLQDFGWFQACLTGSGVPQNDPNCANARLDGDTDVDQDDLALFLQCLNGANLIVDPLCHE